MGVQLLIVFGFLAWVGSLWFAFQLGKASGETKVLNEWVADLRLWRSVKNRITAQDATAARRIH